MNKQRASARFRFTGAALLLSALMFLVPAVQSGDQRLYLLAVLVPCLMFLCGTLLARMFSLDRMLLMLSLWLCAVGIAALALSDPEAALAQSLRCGAGLAALLAGGILVRSLSPSLLTSVCSAFIGLLLLAGKLIAPSFAFPLEQAALAILLLSFSSLFARQGPVSAALMGAAALALLLVRGSIMEALLWGSVLLMLLFAADGRLMIVLPSLAVVLILVFAAFRLFPVPGAPAGSALPDALVSAGAFGADTLPEVLSLPDSESLLPRLAGHYGLVFTGLTVLLFLPLFLRGSSAAVYARTRFHAMLAMGASLLLVLRTLAALLSALSFLPLSGADLPLLTVSLPDLCAQLFLVGLLCGISGRNDADLAEDAHLAMLAG